jgi:purine-binding chemotaxis protein CheW
MERVRNKHKNVFLSFKLGKETFAVSVNKVLEVLQKQHITEIPDLPKYIKGVINFRGDILPVFDARLKFNLEIPDNDIQNVIIVFDLATENKKTRIGGVVDGVKDVLPFEESEIKPVPELGLKYNADYIKGMIKMGENFIMVLDIDKVFSDEESHTMITKIQEARNIYVKQKIKSKT